jgi:hypothetical protein
MCVACGSAILAPLATHYARCEDCVESDRPHSLAIARQVRTRRWHARHGLDDYDPAGSALAA